MNRLKAMTILLFVVLSTSIFAQKVKIKKEIAFVNGVEYLKINKSGSGGEASFYVNTIEDNTPVIVARSRSYSDPERSTNQNGIVLYLEVYIEGSDSFFEVSSGLSAKKTLIKLIVNSGFYANGKIDIEKAKSYEIRNGKRHTERQIELNKLLESKNKKGNIVINLNKTKDGKSTTTNNCNTINDSDFRDALKAIEGEINPNSKLTLAKQIAKTNCLTVVQIKQIIALLNFDTKKLDFAKYAYPFCFDRGNYWKVNDSFIHTNTKNELNKFIESQN